MFKIFRVPEHSDSNTARQGYKQHLGVVEPSTSEVFLKRATPTLSVGCLKLLWNNE